MNQQEIFDKVWAGLKSQGFVRSMDGTGCAYRGNNGMKCAAGWLITDDNLAAEWEGSSIQPEWMGQGGLPEETTNDNYGLIRDLQVAHDHGVHPVTMQEGLTAVARKYQLSVPE
jgi:hypothetical protein